MRLLLVSALLSSTLVAMEPNQQATPFDNAYFWRTINAYRLQEIGKIEELTPADWHKIMEGQFVELSEPFILKGCDRAFLVGSKRKKPWNRGYWWVVRKDNSEQEVRKNIKEQL